MNLVIGYLFDEEEVLRYSSIFFVLESIVSHNANVMKRREHKDLTVVYC